MVRIVKVLIHQFSPFSCYFSLCLFTQLRISNIHQIALKLDMRRSASSQWTILHCYLASIILNNSCLGGEWFNSCHCTVHNLLTDIRCL